MVHLPSRILPLFLMLAFLVVDAFSTRSSTPDTYIAPVAHYDMMEQAKYQQMRDMGNSGIRYTSDGIQDFRHIPNFSGRAAEYAWTNGLKFVGQHGTENYYYSIIKPNTVLGSEMGLMRGGDTNRVASVLWEHNPRWSFPELVGVETIKDYNYHWPMEGVQSLIPTLRPPTLRPPV